MTGTSLWSVRTFLIWLVLACLLPGVIGASILFTVQYRESRARQEQDTIHTARALVQAADSHLLTGQTVAQVLSTSELLARNELEHFHARARQVIDQADLATYMVLRDKAGRQILNTAVEFGDPLPSRPEPERVHAVFASRKPVITDAFFGPILKRPVVNVDVPVIRGGEVVYALSVGILPEHFNSILKAQGLPPEWVIEVLDRSGTIVGRTHVPDERIGTVASTRLLEAILKTPEGAIGLTTQEGLEFYSFYSQSALTKWSVVIKIPRHVLEEALALPLFMLAAGVAALFAIGLLLAWLVGGRIAHSVNALTAPAMTLGSANPLPVPSVHLREAAEVGLAIDRAGKMLRERAAALGARDAELAEAHRLAKIGTWYWHLASGEVKVGASTREVYGREVPSSFQEERGTLLTIDSWERVNLAAQEACRTGEGYDLELQANHGDGHLIWVNAKCESIRDEAGEVVALRGTIQDITERKKHEEAMQASERDARDAARQAEAERRLLDAVLEATPVGIVVADARGVVLKSNAANRRLWADGSSPENGELYRPLKGWWADGSARHGQPVASHEFAMARALRGEETIGDIIEINSAGVASTSTDRCTVLVHGAPVRDGAGKVVGGVVAKMDITDRVKAEEALKQADRRKDEFLVMLAHELRNPLAPIAAAAHLLGLGHLDQRRIEQTSTIIARQVRHMTGLVDDLLDVSRVTRGLIVPEKRKLDVKSVVADAIEQVKPLVEARQHHLAVHLPREPAFVLGDQKRLVQVMTNLLNNAAKFTPEGGNLDLSVQIEDGIVNMIVSDNGIGMSPAMVERAFELFSQGERTPDRAQGGLGIGLALVKGLVDLHQGRVTAYSEGLGKGSRFTVRLKHEAESPVPSGTEQGSVMRTGGAALKIMVVDDNADAAEALAMLLEVLGHQVLVENNSTVALERATEEKPDLCLLDIGLPEMDGIELARRLRARPETAGAKLVAVTGYGQEQDRNKALAAGFDHYFVKPLDVTKLSELLREIRPLPR